MSNYIPSEVLPQILCRLPTKTLILCTAVSKKWLSLITSTHFISAHLRRPKEQLLLLRHYSKTLPREHYSLHLDSDFSSPTPIQNLPFPFLAESKFYFRFIGSADGLVCLSDDFFGPIGTVILWNPLVRRFLKLPKPLVSAATHGPHMTVLGFGSTSGPDQKVVRLSYLKASELVDVTPPLVELYSVRRGGWRAVNAGGVDLCVMEHWWTQSFVSGSVHWISYKRRERVGFDLWILAFDVEKEVFKKMKLPDLMTEKWPVFMYMCTPFQGKLAVAEFVAGYYADRLKRTDIWVKNDYGDRRSWTKMFSVSVDGGIGIPLNLTATGRVVFADKEAHLVSYNPETKEAEDLGCHGSFEALHLASFTPSLVLLDKQSQAISHGAQDHNRTLRWCQDGSAVAEEYDDTNHLLGGMADLAMGLVNGKFQYSEIRKVIQYDPPPPGFPFSA